MLLFFYCKVFRPVPYSILKLNNPFGFGRGWATWLHNLGMMCEVIGSTNCINLLLAVFV